MFFTQFNCLRVFGASGNKNQKHGTFCCLAPTVGRFFEKVSDTNRTDYSITAKAQYHDVQFSSNHTSSQLEEWVVGILERCDLKQFFFRRPDDSYFHAKSEHQFDHSVGQVCLIDAASS